MILGFINDEIIIFGWTLFNINYKVIFNITLILVKITLTNNHHYCQLNSVKKKKKLSLPTNIKHLYPENVNERMIRAVGEALDERGAAGVWGAGELQMHVNGKACTASSDGEGLHYDSSAFTCLTREHPQMS